MAPAKYLFSKTLPQIAAVIAKIRLMESLSYKEEMIYLTQVIGKTKLLAQKFIDSRNSAK